MKHSWYLYVEYDKKLRQKNKVAIAFMAVSVMILLFTNIVFSNVSHLLENLQQNCRTIMVQVPFKEKYLSMLKAEYAENPDIESVEEHWTGSPIHVETADPDIQKWAGGQYRVQFSEITDAAAKNSRQIKKKAELKENEILVPKYITIYIQMKNPYDVPSAWDDYTRPNLKGEELIGRTLQISFGDETAELVVRGVYDNAEITTAADGIFLSEAMTHRVAQETKTESNFSYHILIKDYEKMKIYQKEISDFAFAHFDTEDTGMDDTGNGWLIVGPAYGVGEQREASLTFINAASVMAGILAVVVMLWVGLGLFLSKVKMLNARGREFALLKAIGYRERQIRGILRMESIMLSAKVAAISGIIVGSLLIVYVGILLIWVNPLFYHVFMPRFQAGILFLTVLIVFLVPLAAYELSARRIKSVSSIEILR